MRQIIEEIDGAKARIAFDATVPLLDAQTELRRANTGVDKVIVFGATTGRMVMQPAVLTRFASLPASEFDLQHVLRLEQVALAAWHARLSLRSALVTAGIKIPESVMNDGTALKQLMLKVLEYNLGDNEDVVAELLDIRDGTGYVDLASDLVRLAALYQRFAQTLILDVRYYKADDADLASRTAQAIHQVLGDGRNTSMRTWSNYVARAWSLLVITYGEVSAAGRWLFRHENGEALFPSLYTIGRQRRS
ncbi:MAG TPA: hypothetical protein VNM90_03405, partial [Haliangium sp.]|nr:hypothetical protein [Haliangium sp.]